ncbi:MAG: hypothetical protein ACOWWM_19295, partial [Desulfobacterales bacterium]
MARSAIGSSLRSLITLGVAQTIGLGVEHVVKRLLHGAADHLAQMVPDLSLIDFNHIIQVLARIGRITVLHHQVLSFIEWFSMALSTIDQRKDRFDLTLKSANNTLR